MSDVAAVVVVDPGWASPDYRTPQRTARRSDTNDALATLVVVQFVPRPRLDDFTVVIPTLGRRTLERCLESVARGEAWPGRLVVVDQGSNPDVAAWTSALDAAGIPSQHIKMTETGTAQATNRGLERVETRWVAVTHDDCLVTPSWLRLISRRLEGMRDAIVTGQVRAEPGRSAPGLITDPDPVTHTRPLLDWDPLFPDNMAFPMSVVERVGWFSEDPRIQFAEDAEWSYRALRRGISIVYDPEIVVTHLAIRDLDQRAATYRRYGRSQGAFYGMYVRKGDWFAVARFVYDMARGPWMWLRGTLMSSPDTAAYGRAYMTQLLPGFVAGLRDSSAR